jgi:SPOR domain
MATRRKDDDALGRLAEVMVEDILETPRTELLAEVAEDHGDNQALSANFDRLVRPAVRRAEMRSANVVRAEREKPRSVEAIGPQQSSAGRTLVSTVIGWLKALQERTFFSGSGSLFPGNVQVATASLLVVALIATAAFLIVKEFSAKTIMEETASSTSPSRLELTPEPKRSAPARNAESVVSPGTYMVEVAGGQNEEEARTNYRALQMKFPSILKARDPLIRPTERVGDGDDRHYVAAVGPFTTIEQARGLCDELKAAGGQCITGEYSR